MLIVPEEFAARLAALHSRLPPAAEQVPELQLPPVKRRSPLGVNETRTSLAAIEARFSIVGRSVATRSTSTCPLAGALTARSTAGSTVNATEAASLPALSSRVAEPRAEMLLVPTLFPVTLSVIVAPEPAASVPIAQLAVPAPLVQLPTLDVTVTKTGDTLKVDGLPLQTDEGGQPIPGAFAVSLKVEGAFVDVTGDDPAQFEARFGGAMKLKYGWLVMAFRWPTLFVLLALVLAFGAIAKIVRTRRRMAAMED